jgi:hypothetical protein
VVLIIGTYSRVHTQTHTNTNTTNTQSAHLDTRGGVHFVVARDITFSSSNML